MSCINRNLQEYKDLKNSLGSNDLELNLIIKKFNKVTGNEETYLPKASELKEFKDSQKFKSQTFSEVRSRPIKSNIKPGVEELFESNPELANAIYKALGFKVSNSSISLDKINNTKVGEVVTLFINNMPVEYKRVSENYFEGKQITKKQETDFINSLEATTISIEEFIEKEGTKVRYSLDEFIDFYLDKLPTSQITPQQKQQALQLYSQYLDTIFPENEIFYRGDIDGLDNFEYAEALTEDERGKIVSRYKFGSGIYLTKNQEYVESFAKDKNGKKYTVLSDYSNVISFKNKLEFLKAVGEFHNKETVPSSEEIDQYTKSLQEEGKALFIESSGITDELILGSNKQLSILGSKQDIEGFKEFVSTQSERQYQKPAQTKKRSDARVNLRSFNSDTEVLKGESEKVGQEPTELTLRQVLDQVNKGASPIVKYVLKLIQKHIPEGLTIVVQDDVVENDEDGNPISVNGVYDGARNVIRVSRQATNLESTLLHELIHAGTVRIFKAYRENPSMFKGKEYANIMRFMSLWERVRKQAIKDGVELGQAAESVEEFITALYTNKEVQEYLAGIKPEIENNNNESWLTKLINSLLDILGFSNESSALREAVKLSGLMLGTMVTDTRQVVISERYNELSQEDYNILTSQFTGENITKEQKEVASKLMLESKSFSLSDDGVNYSDKSGNLYKRVSNWIKEMFPDYAFEDTNNEYTKNRSWGNQIDEILTAVILEKELDEDLKNIIRSRAETYEDGALIKDEVIEKVYDYFKGWVQEKREQGYIVLPQITIGNPDVEGGGVAGTLDVALVDKKGILHIVDLKSSINSVHGDKYTSYKISKKKRHTASMSSYKGLAHSLGIEVSPKLEILPVKLDNLDEQGEDLGEVQDVEFEDIVQLTPNLNFVRPLAVQTSEKSTFREDARYNSLMEKILVTLKNKAIELKNSGKTDFFVEELIDRLQTMEPLLAVEAFVDDAFTQFEGEEGKFYGYSDSIKFLIKSKDSIEEKLKRAEELQSTMYLYDKVFDEIKEIYDRLVMEEAIEVFEGSTLDKLNQLIIKSTTEKNNINNLLVDLQAQVLADASPQSAELSVAVKEQIKKLKKQLEAAQGVYEQSKRDGKPQRVLVRQKNKITNLKNLIEKLGDQSGLDAKDFKKELLYGAEQDIDFVDLWVRPFIQSPSKVLANFTRKIKQAFEKARITSWEASMDFTKGFEKFRDYQKSLGISQGNVAEFNKKFYKVVGKHYSYVSNIDFEKYRLARNELYETLKQMEESGATQEEISSVRKSWYKNNTTNLPMQDVTVTNPITKETVVMIKGLETIRAERLEIFRGNEQKTDRWMRAAAAKGELSMPNANFKDNTIDNFTAQEKEYYDLLMYYHFSALQNYPEVNLSTSFKVPSIAKVSNDRVRENGIVNYLKYKFGSSYQEVSEDIEMYGAKNKVIPLTYMQPMDIEDVSLDLGASTMRFYDASLQYKARVELKSLGDSLLRTVQKTKPNETGTAGKVLSRAAKALGMEIPDKKEGQSNIEFALTELIAHHIYGKNSKREIIYGKDANKIVGSLMGIASFTQIGGNPLLSAANVVVGNLSNLIESAAGKHFNTKNWAKALVEYELNEVNFVKDFTNPVNKSKLGQLIDIYDALQGEYKDKFGRKLTMGGMKKAWSKDTWFYLQHKGEHQVQVTAMIAKMLSTPATLNGKQINLLEAYSIGKDGKLTIDPNTIVNGKKVGNQLVIPEVQSSLHRINKDMHGVYNSFDSPLLERYSVGKLLMMYRKFVVPGFMRRFSGMRVEQESGELLEGYWRTFANLMLNDFTELRKFLTPGAESQLTSLEKENVKRTLTEMGIIVALMILSLAFGKMTDDEDEDSALYYPYYLAYRVRTEMMFFFNPLDTLRMFRTPTIAYSVVEKLMRLLIQLTNPFETYERRSGMAKKGDNKLKIKTLKLLGINGYTANPKEALDMMKMFTN